MVRFENLPEDLEEHAKIKDVLLFSASVRHPEIRHQRYRAACRAAAELTQASHVVISPVVHSHPLTEFELPTGWEFWHRIDLA